MDDPIEAAIRANFPDRVPRENLPEPPRSDAPGRITSAPRPETAERLDPLPWGVIDLHRWNPFRQAEMVPAGYLVTNFLGVRMMSPDPHSLLPE